MPAVDEGQRIITPDMEARQAEPAADGEPLRSTDPLPETNPIKGETDKFGWRFDPEYHETDKVTGQPVLSRDGFLRIRKGKRRREVGSQLHIGDPARAPAAGQQDPAGAVTVQRPAAQAQAAPQVIDPESCRLAAAVTVEQFQNINVLLLGPAYRMQKGKVEQDGVRYEVDERKGLEDALTAYFIKKGITDVPAGIALVIAVGSYYGARFGVKEVREQTKQSLLGRVWCKMKLWWVDRKARKIKRRIEGEQLDDHPREAARSAA